MGEGTIGFGFMFYDAGGVYISESYVTTSGAPTDWTQFKGVITVPVSAVTAVPVVQVIGHTSGMWCLDDVYAIRAGGHFVLSSIKHYYDQYISNR